MIPQYRTLKLKLPKYRNTVNPHVPLFLRRRTNFRPAGNFNGHFVLTTLGTRGFSRVRWEFSVLAEGRLVRRYQRDGAPVQRLPACRRLPFPLLHASNKGNRRRLHAGKSRGFARVTIKTWRKPETAVEKSLAPRVCSHGTVPEHFVPFTRTFERLGVYIFVQLRWFRVNRIFKRTNCSTGQKFARCMPCERSLFFLKLLTELNVLSV